MVTEFFNRTASATSTGSGGMTRYEDFLPTSAGSGSARTAR